MLTELLIFILTSFFAYALYSYKRNLDKFKSAGLKYLPIWPFVGNNLKSLLLKQHVLDDIIDIYNAFPEERYVGYTEFTTPVVLIRDPELIKQITVKDFDHFTDHRIFFGDDLFSDSLFSMKGEKWRDMRTTLSPAFTGSKMRLMVPFMVETSENVIQYLKEIEGQELHLDNLIRRYTNDVIASTAFGLSVNSVKDPDNEFYTTGQRLVNFTTLQRLKLVFMSMFPSLGKWTTLFPIETTNFFRDLVKNTMKYREENNIERPDMIHLLMEASKGTLKSTYNGEKDSIGFATAEDIKLKSAHEVRSWTQDELAAQAFIFFFAGYESSASALVMTIHELALNEDVQEKLFKEIKQNSLKYEKPTFESIQDLKYMDAVINETLRMWSPALILDRLCLKDYVLPPSRKGAEPLKLRKNDIVYNAVNPIHMDEQYYSNPKKFDPDRFSDENKAKIHPFTFLTFGSGPRNCIGSRFALLELKIFLYYLVLNFKILKSEKTMHPIKLDPKSFNLKCKDGSWVRLASRS